MIGGKKHPIYMLWVADSSKYSPSHLEEAKIKQITQFLL
jgi:hypothetical protein